MYEYSENKLLVLGSTFRQNLKLQLSVIETQGDAGIGNHFMLVHTVIWKGVTSPQFWNTSSNKATIYCNLLSYWLVRSPKKMYWTALFTYHGTAEGRVLWKDTGLHSFCSAASPSVGLGTLTPVNCFYTVMAATAVPPGKCCRFWSIIIFFWLYLLIGC